MSIPRQHFLLGWLVVAMMVAAAPTQESDKPLSFALRTTDGVNHQGAWRELQSDWSVRIGAGVGKLVAGANVISVRRLAVPLPPFPTENHLLLANGDRLPFRALRLSEEKFYLRHPLLGDGQEVSVPLTAVVVLWRSAPDRSVDVEKLRRRLTAAKRSSDVVCLRNGDQVAGVLTSLDERNIIVEAEKRRVTLRLEQAAYIAFNTELVDALRPKGAYARLILTEGSAGRGGRISLTSARADGTTLTGTTVFGARLRVPLRDIAGLDLHQDHFVYLSDLKASKYVFSPFLDAAWPVGMDGNVAEHDLVLAGSTYEKGLGLHSHSRLTYRLKETYRRFEARVGLDDRDGREGSVRVRVLADGEARVDRELTPQDGAVPISLSLEGVRELTLEVDFGAGGDVQDVVNWVDARLVK
jgi:hypothetical protein